MNGCILWIFFFFFQEMMSWMTFISVISTLCFVIFFSVGPGSIPWMITAELFSQGPRPAAMSIAVLVNWLSNFLVGIGFPKMQVRKSSSIHLYMHSKGLFYGHVHILKLLESLAAAAPVIVISEWSTRYSLGCVLFFFFFTR